VRLTEIEDPNELNNQVYRVTAVLNSYKFKIEAKTSETKKYSRGGIFRKIKKKQTLQFGSLESQLENPELVLADLSATKFSSPNLVHVLVKSHLTLCGQQQSEYSLETFLKHVKEASKEEDIERLARVFYLTKRARFPPLSAIYGGVCAQEALKSITSKFIPIKQWLYLEFSELFEVKSFDNFNVASILKLLILFYL
jgi:ubiquitin-activating enzyme E1